MNANAIWFTAKCNAEILPVSLRPCGDEDVIVKSLYSGISGGTELIIYRGQGPTDQPVTPITCEGKSMGTFPVKYGYANVGRVLEAGKKTPYKPNDLLFVQHPHQDIYTVNVNLPGIVYKLPEYEHPEIGIFCQLLDVSVNAFLDVHVRPGDVVAVFGLGTVGLFCSQLAKRMGSKVVAIDPIPLRRELASRFGMDMVVEPNDAHEAVKELSEGRGADVSIEASGAPSALQLALKSTGFEGTICVVSWYGSKPIQLVLSPEFHMGRQKMVSSQVCVIGSGLQPRWTIERRMRTTIDLLPSLGPLDMITHRFPFTKASEAYALIDNHPEEVLAVAFYYE